MGQNTGLVTRRYQAMVDLGIETHKIDSHFLEQADFIGILRIAGIMSFGPRGKDNAPELHAATIQKEAFFRIEARPSESKARLFKM